MKVELILDSSIAKTRVTLFRVTYPRIVHAELLRHRQFSICSSSSRAIPLDRMIDQYCNFYPSKWRKHQPGMQPNESHEFTPEQIEEISELYETSRFHAIEVAKQLHQIGVAKEQVNRLIEPYSDITHLMQGTETAWEAFFKLRCDKNAQYEIRQLAEEIKFQYLQSKPIERDIHIPFLMESDELESLEDQLKISAARCARTSFYNHDGKSPSFAEDAILANRLLTDQHMSPFEFPVMDLESAFSKVMSNRLKATIMLGHPDSYSQFSFSGNLNTDGLVQYRKIMEAGTII